MYEQISIEKIEPNTWNPNVMPPEIQVKLEEGIKRTLESAGKMPPIVVRPKKGKKGYYEIIDGFHRWSILKKLKQPKADAFILEVPDDLARVLTATLNYIKGEADPDKYPLLVVEALKANPDLDLADLATLLPESADMLQELILASEAASDALNALVEAETETATDDDDVEGDPDRWVALNFTVPLEVAGLVEAELDRISERLSGKNRRMRALEYMAAMSSQTPLDTIDKRIEEKEPKKEDAKAAPSDAGFTSDVETPKPVKPVKAALEEAAKGKKPASAPKKGKK